MNDRVKFEIWNERKQYWARSYCKLSMLVQNFKRMKAYGLRVRIGEVAI